MASFTTTDGLRLAYMIDDFTDPWKQAPTLLLLHAAMGSASAITPGFQHSPATIGWCGWICAGMAARRSRRPTGR